MPVLLKSNIGTRKDPTRRGGQKHFLIRKGRMCIGAKQLGPACSIIVSDDTYEKHKKLIETFIGLGALEAKILVGSLDGDELLAATGGATSKEASPVTEKGAASIDAVQTEDVDDVEAADGDSGDAEHDGAQADSPATAAKRRGRKKASEE